MRPDILDHGIRMVSGAHDSPQYLPDLIEVRLGAIKPVQSRLGAGDDRRQRLFDFVGNGGRDDVTGHQPRLTLAALRQHRAEQVRVKRRYLVHQDK